MAEYIDKQELVKSIVNTPLSWDFPVTPEHLTGSAKRQNEILTLIDDMPAADVRENVKGEWLYVVEEIEGTTFRGRRCSKCNYWKGMGIFNFCPNCGADMNTPKKERHACRPL